jgi:hypothetical protein
MVQVTGGAMTTSSDVVQQTRQQPKSGIVWIASYPKSGNTWTRTFLHNLAHIMYSGADRAVDINAITQFSTWEIDISHYTDVLGFCPTNAHRKEISAVRNVVQQRIADEYEGLVFVKTHHALVSDRGRPIINGSVTSGAIYIVRNPLDVAISFAHHRNKSIDDTIMLMGIDNVETEVNDKAVYEVLGSWSQHVLSWTRQRHPAIYVMRYEDMLAEPEIAFGALVRHLNLRPTSEQFTQAIERSSFRELQAQEEMLGFREKPEKAERFFREGRAGQWKDVLNTEQVSRMVNRHRDQMARFGYVPDGL